MPAEFAQNKLTGIHRKNNGLAHRKTSDDTILHIFQLRTEGKKLREIAQAVQMSESRICVILSDEDPNLIEAGRTARRADVERLRPEIESLTASGNLSHQQQDRLLVALGAFADGKPVKL